MADLAELERHLIAAIRMTGTSSYERSAPSPRAIPALVKSKLEIRGHLETEPDSHRAWILLSRVEESLQNYAAAIRCLENAAKFGDRSKKSRKRLAILRQAVIDQRKSPLTTEQSVALTEHLELHNADEEAFGNGLDVTRDWLFASDFSDPDSVLKSFDSHGCFSDCDIFRWLSRDVRRLS